MTINVGNNTPASGSYSTYGSMNLQQAYNRSQTSQALVDSVQTNSFGYGNMGNYNFNLSNWRNEESLNASMGNSNQSRFGDWASQLWRGKSRNFTVVQDDFNKKLLAASETYLSGNKDAAIEQFKAIGVQVDPKKDNTAEIGEVYNGIALAQTQARTVNDRNKNYADYQKQYLYAMGNVKNGYTEKNGLLYKDGVLDAQATRQYQYYREGAEGLPSDKRAYLDGKLKELEAQGVDTTKYRELFDRDKYFNGEGPQAGEKAFMKVTSEAKAELSRAVKKARDTSGGKIDEKEIMNKALAGDPAYADVLKQMQAVRTLGGYSDASVETTEQKFNNSLLNAGFGIETKENQVAILASGGQQVDDKLKQVKGGVTIRESQEKVIKELDNGVIIQTADGKYFKKTSSYDKKEKLRMTYSQEVDKNRKALGNKTAYIQKRSEDGQLRGELVKVELGGKASEQAKALKKAKEVALDKNKALERVGSSKVDYKTQPNAGKTDSKGATAGTVLGSAAAGAGAGATVGTAVGLAGGIFAPVTVPVGAIVGGVTGAISGANADKKQGTT